MTNTDVGTHSCLSDGVDGITIGIYESLKAGIYGDGIFCGIQTDTVDGTYKDGINRGTIGNYQDGRTDRPGAIIASPNFAELYHKADC